MRKMKDSGIEWIGEIPESWNTIPLSKLSERMNNGYVGPTRGLFVDDGIRYLQSLHIKSGNIIFDKCPYYVTEEWAAEHPTGVVRENDVLIVQTGDIGQVAYVPYEFDGCNCHALIIVTPRVEICEGEYLSFLLQGHYAHHQLQSRKTGALHPHLNCRDIKDIKLPIPPLNIQRKLISYIKEKVFQVDTIIAAKEKTNALLKERRQSIIYEAVTKGLDPTVPMKDSGVEWIGEIPEKFQLIRLKYLCEIFGRIGFRGYTQADLVAEGEGPITLSPSNISENGMDYSKCTYLTWDKYYESPEIQIENNDILLVKTGSSYGKSTIVENLPMEATINPQFVVMKNIKCHPKFLHYIMQTKIIKYQVEQVVVGGTIPTMAQEKINNFYIVLPSEDEICTIVNYLDGTCAEFDTLISANEATIQKLKEYRQSVIYEAVTGKIEI